MASGNFERCLAETLKWEGGYSNHPDDPGGPTMRGIIQREYDDWRKKHGRGTRPVKQIDESELQAIYRGGYWDSMDCDSLPAGMDLCVFDAAVNSGVSRAHKWLEQGSDVDAFCDARLTFLRGLGRLWRVFGAGWSRRVAGIRNEAHLMTGSSVTVAPQDLSLHAGMKGASVKELQEKLGALGYPCGAADGIFGEKTYRAIVLFQHDNGLTGEPGIWLPSCDEVLATHEPQVIADAPAMTVTKAIATSPTLGATTIGAGAAVVQAGSGIWSWLTDAGQQITAAQGASGPFGELFKVLHINMANVTLTIIIGALVFVGVRHVMQKRQGIIP
jgi:lysozyme family protein